MEEIPGKRIKKGTTLITAKPFTYVLSSKQKGVRCETCFKSCKLFKCSGCQYVYYCDRTCQREAWSMHKWECTNLKRVSPRVVPDAARFMARVIIKLNNGGHDECAFYSKTQYRKFKDLMSHYSDIKEDKDRMEHFMSLCGVLTDFLGPDVLPNTAEMMGIYGRICVNSFDILDSELNSIGVGLYLAPSIIDHSCKPNAVAVFEGTTLSIRTLEDLPCLDWSKIRISYIDALDTTRDRQSELLGSYYFLCDCPRCKHPEPAACAAACPNATCTNPCNFDDEFCEKCGAKFPENFKETFEEVTELTAHHLQEMKKVAYLDVSTICLKKQDRVLHPLNVKHVQTVECAFHAAINLNYWEQASKYSKELINGYLLYHGETHPATGLLYLLRGKLLLHLGEAKEALDLLKKADPILTISHGENHSLIRETLRPLLYQAMTEAR